MPSAARSVGVSPISPGFVKVHSLLPPVNAYVASHDVVRRVQTNRIGEIPIDHQAAKFIEICPCLREKQAAAAACVTDDLDFEDGVGEAWRCDCIFLCARLGIAIDDQRCGDGRQG